MKKSWLVKEAEKKGALIGMEINLIVDNSPINGCFKKVEALKNGVSFKEKSAAEILLDEVIASARRTTLIK